VEGSCEHGNEPSGFHKILGVAAQLAASQEGLRQFLEVSYVMLFNDSLPNTVFNIRQGLRPRQDSSVGTVTGLLASRLRCRL
jgi:hypothetical protein